MIKAEWENWLLDENNRCRQVRMMLEDNKFNSTADSKGKEVSKDMQLVIDKRTRKVENLRRWQDEYCGSCRRDQEALFGEGRGSRA